MNILVTGASGFIGKYLIDEIIEHGHNVKILTRKSTLNLKNVNIISGDITKTESIFSAFDNIETVFHNAAYVTDYGNKEDLYKTNILGTKNIAEICLKKGIKKIVYTSTSGIYGFPNTNMEISENSVINPYNVYHKSKLKGEEILNNYEDLSIIIIRPTLVLGAGGDATKILIDKFRNRKIFYIGSGEQYISLAHPKDVAQCLRLGLYNDKKKDVFNVVSCICKIKELYSEIASQLNIEIPNKYIPYNFAYLIAFFSEIFASNVHILTRYKVKTFGTTRRINCDKAKKILGYKPKYNLQLIVEDMVSWYKKNYPFK